jgi:threonine dehydrogenase-like Zn-dependent dehydrogenase
LASQLPNTEDDEGFSLPHSCSLDDRALHFQDHLISNDHYKTSLFPSSAHDPINDPALENDAYDLVIDAVGGGVTRKPAMAAVKTGGMLVHIGLMDAEGVFDIRKLTLFEVKLLGVYCYTPADVRAAVQAIESGLLGDLNWVETRPLSEGAQAFQDLDEGRTAEAKIVLIP